jgi:hypothetical protein
VLSAWLATAGGVVPEVGPLAFRVIRKDSAIGSHGFTFVREGDRLTVSIAADIAVGFGPFTLFRYRHRAVERWQGDMFLGIEAETDDNGTKYKVSVRREDGGLRVVRTPGASYLAPDNALAATHWNQRMLSGPMINNQTGDLMRPAVASVGPESVRLFSGASVRADHFTLRGDADLDTWYEPSSAWAGLRFTGKDGSAIRYERV